MEKINDNWIDREIDGKYFKINTETGETREGHERILYDGDLVITPEMQDARRKYMEMQAEQQKRKSRRRDISKKNGEHYFVPRLHSFPDLKPQTAARLIYLFTYADYSERDSYLKLTQKKEMEMTGKMLPKHHGYGAGSIRTICNIS